MELTADSVVEVELQNSDDVRNVYMGVIMAVLATMIIIFLSVGLFIFVRYQCSVYDEAESPSKFVFVREPMNYDLNDLALSLPNGKIVNNKVLSLASDGGTVSRDAMVVLSSSEKQLKKFEEEEEGSFQETESQWCETNNSLGSFSEKNHFCIFLTFFKNFKSIQTGFELTGWLGGLTPQFPCPFHCNPPTS